MHIVRVLPHAQAGEGLRSSQAGAAFTVRRLRGLSGVPSLGCMAATTEERAHPSLWTRTAPLRSFPALAGDREVDVAIIGAGIAGLTAALLLKRAGKRVCVLEMHGVGTGQTGQTTAHLTELQDVGYHALQKDFGERGARLAAGSSRAAIEQIASLVESLRIDCDFRRLPAYVYAEDATELARLEQELAAARDAGLSARLTPAAPTPFETAGALRVEDQAQFHVLKYLRALAEAVDGDGSHVFERTRVVDLKDGRPCRVLTDRGTVVAGDVLEATTTPLNRVALHTKLYPYRTYALAARVERPFETALYYDLKDPYHYVRTQPSPEGTLAIIGGEDHKVGEVHDTGACYARLEAYARARWGVGEVVARWSGQVIEPADGLPYIGRNVASRHTWVATGFSGTGMTFGTLAGMVLCDLVQGRPNAYAKLYAPGRVTPGASAKDFVQENADVAFRWVADRLSRPDGRALADVPAGEGRVLEVDGRKVAVFREPGGACHAVSPVCTHLGCHVHWNRAERSWDCPCHGARYSPTGRVLNGPAVKDLASRPLPPHIRQDPEPK